MATITNTIFGASGLFKSFASNTIGVLPSSVGILKSGGSWRNCVFSFNNMALTIEGAASRCWDNAPSESFFKTLKAELMYHENFRTKKEAESAIFDFIEIWYNRKRKHTFLNYQTPCEKEMDYLKQYA
ncbi:IS3 family transposase [Rhizosphaericola mali]|nr:IS3 family transposase [Rhizosphaericola mali]